MYPPLIELGNIDPWCVSAPDALITGCHYHIVIPAPSALYLPLQHCHHHPVLVTPIFDVGESNSEILSHLGPRHRCQMGTNTSLALSFIPPVLCPVQPPWNHSFGHRWMLCCRCWHAQCLPLMPIPTMPSVWAAIFFISKILSSGLYVCYSITTIDMAVWCIG